MQLNRIGNLEQESDLSDLDELERELEMELEDEQPEEPQQMAAQDLKAAKAAPPVMSATPQQNNTFLIANGKAKGSKFAPQAKVSAFGFFPDQPAAGDSKATAQERKRDPFMTPISLFDSKFAPRPRQKPANDSKNKLTETVDVGRPEPQTPKSSRSRFARSTVEALLSIGALPLQLLIEIGRFRFAKEHRFNSLQRLEKALGQGNEDAERFLRYHPGALRKKKEPEQLAPPAPPAPTGM
ncbi:MAG: hypothetical protein EPN97_13230 [Alphaproteobacteria bacterium]|nr:MAG: hypothetical protein EPN97_13230 [Alphaproteobacteria bacterium]